MKPIEHGSRGGYQEHTRAGEPACDDCRTAHAQYMAEWRASTDIWRHSSRARNRALVRLSHEHPEDYERLYAQELARQREGADQ